MPVNRAIERSSAATAAAVKAQKRLEGLKVLEMCAVDFTARHFLFPVMKTLRDEGAQVHLACGSGKYLAAIRRENFPIHEIPIKRNLDLLSHLRSLRLLRRLMKQERFDIVHVHTPIAGLLGRLAARSVRTPLIVYTAHGFYFHDDMAPWLRRIVIGLERWGGRLSDQILCVSREDEKGAVELGIAGKDRVHYIGNGVDEERFSPAPDSRVRDEMAERLGVPNDGPWIGIVGRLVPEKGYREFFGALPRVLESHPAARFLVMGEKLESDRVDSREIFRDQLVRSGVRDHVHFLGHRYDIEAILSVLDLFVLPSYREGLPVSILEAMSCSVPVVTTRVRGCRELVTDGETGWLVPTRSASALAEAMTAALDDPARARRFGAAGRERVLRGFREADWLGLQADLFGNWARRLPRRAGRK